MKNQKNDNSKSDVKLALGLGLGLIFGSIPKITNRGKA